MIEKIALLFLTISSIYHEPYWNDFLKGNTDRYSMYIHSKESLAATDSKFKEYEISEKEKVETTWANTMKAQIVLLKEALKDPQNKKFIFLSESTIPLQDFDKVHKMVMETEKSIFPYEPNPHQDINNPLYKKRNLNLVPKEFRYKNPQWVVLNRKHAKLMVEDNIYIEKVTNYEADNELYPATLLASQGLLNNEVENKDTTYVNWHKENPEGAVRKSPYIYSDLSVSEDLNNILKVINDNFLFARKFPEECDLSPLDSHLAYRADKH
jgi:core-2/I-Branching enzyme